MSMAHRILALIIKEFLAILKDPRSRSVILLPPLVQTLLFSYAATFELEDVPFAVYDRDRSTHSRALVAALDGAPNFRRVATLSHHSQIAPVIDARTALLVVQVDPRFERELLAGRPAAVQVIVDGRNSNSASIALNYVNTIVARFSDEVQTQRGRALPGARLVTRAWFNPNLESQWFIVPGIVGLLTFLVTILVTSLSVSREREQGTFDQLLVTPLRPVEILIGKAVPGMVIGTAIAAFIFGIAVTWFEIPFRGSLPTLALGLGIFLLSAVGVGLAISSLAATMQQSLLGTFVVMMPAVILSGFATPIENMSEPVQWMTLANPLRYVMIILRGQFLEGTPLRMLVPQLWPLAIISAVCLTAAGWLFRHRMN